LKRGLQTVQRDATEIARGKRLAVRASRLNHFDFANTATNITTTLAGSTALLAVADCDAGNQPFTNATATSAAGHPLAMAFGT